MAYFLHNKYDAASVAMLAEQQAAGNTVIDYYGLLESGDTTYKNINTAAMPGVVDSLETVTLPTMQASSTTPAEKDGVFEFVSSMCIRSIQRGSIKQSAKAVTASINEVNPDKTMVLIDFAPSSYSYEYKPYVSALTPTSITFTAYNYNANNVIGYQVIEFK